MQLASFISRLNRLAPLPRFVAIGILSLGLSPTTMSAQEGELASDSPQLTAEQERFFESKIRPVLAEHCYRCHSGEAGQTRGGLTLDTREGTHLGGDSGPAIVPGELDASELWGAINYKTFEMPPEGPLPDEVVADFRRWILMGAPDPRVGAAVVVDSKVTDEDIAEGRSFWSFTAPRAAPLPMVMNTDWPRQSLDHYVLAQLEAAGLQPAEDAQPRSLLRRLHFDLIGLPPTPGEIAHFLSDWERDPDEAIATVVDDLLERPQFGERWARHWLDVARYGESAGKEFNAPFPQAWRYRDYVIDAFNEDKPYDEFVREQIAGDLLPAETDAEWAEHLIATGFLAIGPKTLTEQNPRQFEADLVDEQIDVTTRVILGVSVACARCHDHKFDPIPQSDYYAMAGIFQSTETYYGTLNSLQNRRPSDLIVLPIDDPNPFDLRMTRAEVRELDQELAAARRSLAENQRARREARLQARREGKQPPNLAVTVARLNRDMQRVASLESRLRAVDADGTPRSLAMGVQPAERPVKARVLVRGELTQPAQQVEHGLIRVLQASTDSLGSSTESRLTLANWISDETNPLTARVMVNRVWLHLFGEGLVRTPENFGSTGQSPTHPELLDQLALDFMEQDWSLKTLIRKLANSRAYRMASTFDEQAFAADPNNELLWRHLPRRLDAEALRDAMLAISGRLAPERPRASSVAITHAALTSRQGGFGQRPNAAYGPLRNFLRGRSGPLEKAEEAFARTRSVYLPIMRDQLPHELEVFDFAEPSMIIGKRDNSNTPSQALYLMNNDFVWQQSRALAERIAKQESTYRGQVRAAFEHIYGREPTAGELRATESFVRDMLPELRDGRRDQTAKLETLQLVCQSLFASAEFRYLD